MQGMSRAGRRSTSGQPESAAPEATRPRSKVWLVASAVVVVAFFLALRWGAAQPWSYDDYYHLAVARQMGQTYPISTLPWTPFAMQAEAFSDKDLLFHWALVPLAGLPLEVACLVGVTLGLLLLVGATGFFLWRSGVPRPELWLLGLTALGPFWCLRVEALRPHVWALAFCVLVLALLLRRTPLLVIALTSALFGLSHASGWLSVAFVAIWSIAEWARGAQSPRLRLAAPPLAAATGWFAGQLFHPDVARHLSVLWLQNVVVPLSSLGGIDETLRNVLGVELLRPTAVELLEQWPLFVAPLTVIAFLSRRPESRTTRLLVLTALALSFLAGGSLWLRRLLEIGGVLGLLALAVAVAEARDRRSGAPWPVTRPRLALGLLALGALWSIVQVRDLGRGDQRPHGRGQPLGMAGFLATYGHAGDLVFTTQWADSAPLSYKAPELRSLVLLDPNFLARRDRRRFDRYWAIANGRSGDPVGEIGREFGARWVTVWKAPAFEVFARQLRKERRARMVFSDPYYEVWVLAG